MAEWRVYEADTPRCTSCGMWMPLPEPPKEDKNGRTKWICPTCKFESERLPV